MEQSYNIPVVWQDLPPKEALHKVRLPLNSVCVCDLCLVLFCPPSLSVGNSKSLCVGPSSVAFLTARRWLVPCLHNYNRLFPLLCSIHLHCSFLWSFWSALHQSHFIFLSPYVSSRRHILFYFFVNALYQVVDNLQYLDNVMDDVFAKITNRVRELVRGFPPVIFIRMYVWKLWW